MSAAATPVHGATSPAALATPPRIDRLLFPQSFDRETLSPTVTSPSVRHAVAAAAAAVAPVPDYERKQPPNKCAEESPRVLEVMAERLSELRSERDAFEAQVKNLEINIATLKHERDNAMQDAQNERADFSRRLAEVSSNASRECDLLKKQRDEGDELLLKENEKLNAIVTEPGADTLKMQSTTSKPKLPH